jgi:hypothetical protein
VEGGQHRSHHPLHCCYQRLVLQYLEYMPVGNSCRNTGYISVLQFRSGLWIRIQIGSRFSDFVDPDPFWESESRDKKIKKFQWKNAL